MLKDFETLIQMQEIDLAIHALELAQQKLPHDVADLELELKRAGESVETARKKITDLRTEERQTSDLIISSKAMLERSNERLNSITTNREYDALHTEIANHQAAGLNAEARLKTLAQEAEVLQAALAEQEQQYNQFKTESEPRLAECRAKVATLESERQALIARRLTLVPTVAKIYLRPYEQMMLRKKDHIVVGVLSNQSHRTCAVCHKVLEIQLVNEIRRGNKIVYCQTCGSIMLWDDRDPNKAEPTTTYTAT